MAEVALFHSVLGVRPGMHDAAERLRAAGHEVLVVDQYDGRVFEDYDEAGRYAEGVGFPELMRRAVDAVEGLADGLVAVGFSNGAGMAEHVATQRACAGVVLVSGALPLAVLGSAAWRAGTAAQIHGTRGDPFRRQEWLDALVTDIRSAGSSVEIFDYPGSGHLFTDPSLPAEHDPQAAAALWERVEAFCRRATARDRRGA